MKDVREKFDLTESEVIQELLVNLYKHQSHVIVRIGKTVVLDMLELTALRELLVTKGYPQVTVVSKSYGYELEVPTSIER